MLFLGIDTATVRGSIALADGKLTECEVQLEARAWHARDLLEQIDGMLMRAGHAPSDLNGIGVAVGPGSFTGVRIGMATGKGMAYALGIGLAGLSTLEALALAARFERKESSGRLCPIIEAGRGEVYFAEFECEADGVRRLSPDRSRPPHALDTDSSGALTLVGSGAGLVMQADETIRRRATVIDPAPSLAGAIARWAAGRIMPERGYEAGTLNPNYVRPSDAETTRRRR
ncbi:MAG TPA: tRNA (adenosine(37)-N6)-threonylcarbamoyltransferase complex dimerization subunit type 1 TsaB [Candidatus Polarisedimenticolia bacterium]|nr:tRNA (adenosine(37)-N6)-threonylcarbamoyltransferase complex dimerization subunit type 1 TsaB [Candidatus Polarisedimenticolia bacterium]